MDNYTCINKLRDNNGNIKAYILVNNLTGADVQVSSEQLREALKNKRIYVTNLKLSADDKIINNNYSNTSHTVNKIARNYTAENLLNTVYRAENSKEQKINDYILSKSRNPRVGNAILLALKMGTAYSVA